MEAIITIVGFLGSGKTTLLNYLIDRFSEKMESFCHFK
ncbi:hypothetical protein OEG92_09070 [Polaribacter sejongensis]